MNEQNPSPTPTPGTPPPPAGDWRAQRHAERMARHDARMQRFGHRRGWMGGVILIMLGVFLLLQNMRIPFLANWWALFILIPAFWSFVGAWDAFQDGGRLTRRSVRSLTMGIFFTALALIFLLNVELTFIGPILLIAAGAALVLSTALPE
jgi:hypothetical protein